LADPVPHCEHDSNANETKSARRGTFFRIFLPIAFVLCLVFMAFEIMRMELHNVEIETAERNHVELGRISIIRDLETLGGDLAILTSSEKLAKLLINKNADIRASLAQRYLTFSRDRRIYDQIRYIDETGMEIVRINYNGGHPEVVAKDKLQNKANRYYFKETLALAQGNAFLSPLDLNVEKGKIETPHKPMLRLGMPVFDRNGKKRGIVILNYLAQQMLSRYQQSMPEGLDENFILNNEGYWLYSSIGDKTWGFMLDHQQTFYQDHEQAWKYFGNRQTGFSQTSDGFFAFTTINPSLHIQSFGSLPTSSDVWKVGSFSPHESLGFHSRWRLHIPDLSIFAIILVFTAGGCWYLTLAVVARQDAEGHLKSNTEIAILLEKISAAANNASKAEEALQASVDLVCAYTNWPIGHVYLIDDTESELYPTDIWHLDHPERFAVFKDGSYQHKFKSGEGFPGRVWEQKRSLWVANIADFTDFARAHLANEIGLKSGFTFPVLVDHKVVAVLEFFSLKTFTIAPILQDVTVQISTHLASVIERDQASREIIRVKELAEKANLSKSEFLASMSHELRTPLNAVLGFAQMLQFDLKTPLTKNQNESVESILAGGNHLLELVNEILDLAKIEADQMPLYIENVNANEIVADCIALTKPLADPRNITIIDDFSKGPVSLLRTDRLRFSQAVINLLSNAVKYNKDGGTVTVSGFEDEQHFLHLDVTDTGVGIADEDFDNVFEMFNRLGADAMIAQEGTGIGLTVTKLLVEHMAGRITFTSQQGVGSTFSILLPLTSNEDVLIWTDTFNIGIEAIDTDHQMLFTLLNDVTHNTINPHNIDDALQKLIEYTVFHFQREEAIMKVVGYENLENHKILHQKLARQATELANIWNEEQNMQTIRDLRRFLRTWLVGHIKEDDSKIFEAAKGKQSLIHKALENIT